MLFHNFFYFRENKEEIEENSGGRIVKGMRSKNCYRVGDSHDPRVMKSKIEREIKTIIMKEILLL